MTTNVEGPPKPGTDAERDDLGFDLPPPVRVSRRRAFTILVLGVGVLGVVFAASYLPRRAAQQALKERTEAAARERPQLAVLNPKLVATANQLTLPGSLQPLEEAVIYARASGYVRRWHVDIGAKVNKGDLLAEIDAPEALQNLAQARAALAQAKSSVVQAQAGRGLAQIRLERTGKLVEAGVAAQQELDQTQAQATVNDADVQVAESSVVAQQANIRRLTDLLNFTKVEAPFAGTITQRTIETGSLVTAGNGTPLYRLTATDPIRVFVQVPQEFAPTTTVGAAAKVTLREFPTQAFAGTVARTAGALEPGSRTMTTEIRIPNPDGKLLTGMAAEVALSLPSPHAVYQLPSTALLSDAQGLRVLVVQADGKLHLQPIVIERDQGATVQIASGVTAQDRVVQIASADFVEGQQVDVKLVQPPPPKP